jgi:hypothetical protein
VKAVALCCTQIRERFGLEIKATMVDVAKFFCGGGKGYSMVHQDLIMLSAQMDGLNRKVDRNIRFGHESV